MNIEEHRKQVEMIEQVTRCQDLFRAFALSQIIIVSICFQRIGLSTIALYFIVLTLVTIFILNSLKNSLRKTQFTISNFYRYLLQLLLLFVYISLLLAQEWGDELSIWVPVAISITWAILIVSEFWTFMRASNKNRIQVAAHLQKCSTLISMVAINILEQILEYKILLNIVYLQYIFAAIPTILITSSAMIRSESITTRIGMILTLYMSLICSTSILILALNYHDSEAVTSVSLSVLFIFFFTDITLVYKRKIIIKTLIYVGPHNTRIYAEQIVSISKEEVRQDFLLKRINRYQFSIEDSSVQTDRKVTAVSDFIMNHVAKEEEKCVICLDRNIECIFYPCLHGCVCNLCVGNVLNVKSSCSVCRSDIQKVFFLDSVKDGYHRVSHILENPD